MNRQEILESIKSRSEEMHNKTFHWLDNLLQRGEEGEEKASNAANELLERSRMWGVEVLEKGQEKSGDLLKRGNELLERTNQALEEGEKWINENKERGVQWLDELQPEQLREKLERGWSEGRERITHIFDRWTKDPFETPVEPVFTEEEGEVLQPDPQDVQELSETAAALEGNEEQKASEQKESQEAQEADKEGSKTEEVLN